MLLRRIISLFIIRFVAQVWCHVELESEDYFFPLEPTLNYCKLADQCHHDRVQICGQDASGNFRVFRDDCDLYEYCCDEKKRAHGPHRHTNGGSRGGGVGSLKKDS